MAVICGRTLLESDERSSDVDVHYTVKSRRSVLPCGSYDLGENLGAPGAVEVANRNHCATAVLLMSMSYLLHHDCMISDERTEILEGLLFSGPTTTTLNGSKSANMIAFLVESACIADCSRPPFRQIG